MKRENIYLSTIASDAPFYAREYGFGLEIAEFCTAWNIDRRFELADSRVQDSLQGISRSILHAPSNELFPCAIDEKARELAAYRYRQAIDLAKRYGSKKSSDPRRLSPLDVLSGLVCGPVRCILERILERGP